MLKIESEIAGKEIYPSKYLTRRLYNEVYLFVNVEWVYNLYIDDETYVLELTTGEDYYEEDYNSPTNAISLRAVDSMEGDKHLLLNILTHLSLFTPDDITEEFMSELNSEGSISFNIDEITQIVSELYGIKSNCEVEIGEIENKTETNKYKDTHTYVWIKTQSDTYSYQFNTQEEADKYLAGDDDLMGADICDIDRAYFLCDPNLSNFDVETAYQKCM